MRKMDAYAVGTLMTGWLVRLTTRVLVVVALSIPAADVDATQFGADMGVQNKRVALDRNDRELQESLIWTGHYNGLVDGIIGQRTRMAVSAFQTWLGAAPTGMLSDSQYLTLVETASRIRSGYGWTSFQHPTLKYRISYPANLFDKSIPLPNGGRKFTASDPRLMLEVEVAKIQSGLELDELYQTLSLKNAERKIFYKRRKNNWFVISGFFKGTSFYTRVEKHKKIVIGYTFRWPIEQNDRFEAVSLAIASSFWVPSRMELVEDKEPERKEVFLTEPSNLPHAPTAETRPFHSSQPKRRVASLDPRHLFLEVKEAVWMVVAAPMKAGKPDLDNAKQGSAVAISRNRLLTNCHTLKGTEFIVVLRSDPEKTVLPISLVDADEETDRCILGSNKVVFQSFVSIRPGSDAQIGERVYSIGAPSGLDLTIGEGLLSGKRTDEGILYLQNSAPISSGSSGGGLFDTHGNLIGITTFLLRDAQNLNFAISADEFIEFGKSR